MKSEIQSIEDKISHIEAMMAGGFLVVYFNFFYYIFGHFFTWLKNKSMMAGGNTAIARFIWVEGG